ncbi:MAG: hypothetical protein ABR991_00815, partial [Terracidiphilus sp.]
IKDAYDSVVHFSDYKSQKPALVSDPEDALSTPRRADGKTRKKPDNEKIHDYAEEDMQGVSAD